MKILRIHKGFTTNSSAAAEWVPSSTPKKSNSQTSETAAGAGQNQDPLSASYPAASKINPIRTPDGQAAQPDTPLPISQMQSAPQAQTPPPPQSHLLGNSIILGGIIGALAALFFIEKLFRKILTRNKTSQDEQ
jgi:beta-lactamase regulating signal transducer with metallopeptidase domain